MQFASALLNPIPLTTWYATDYSLLGWVDDLTGLEAPPLVVSISYALDSSNQLSDEYQEAASTQFMKAAALGISLIVASGDNGCWGFEGVRDGLKFHTEFPASNPYVTSVGATNFQMKSSIAAESVWPCSGGGFSEHFPTPVWQADVVASYFQNFQTSGFIPPSSMFASSGRGYPDVSVVGGRRNPYCVALDGSNFVGIAGTSGAASMFAAMVAILNNARMQVGKSSLGFVNPLLYANPQCFKDVNDYSRNNCIPGVN